MSHSPESRGDAAGVTRTIRYGRQYFVFRVTLAVFAYAVAIAILLVEHGNVVWRWVALLGGVVPAALQTLAVAIGYFSRYLIDPEKISFRGPAEKYMCRLADVTQINWKTGLDPAVVLTGGDKPFTVTIGHLDDADGVYEIRLLRQVFPSAIQAGWDEFCWRAALPRRDGWSTVELGYPEDLLGETDPSSTSPPYRKELAARWREQQIAEARQRWDEGEVSLPKCYGTSTG